ncbi:MAG: hypothetical protein JWM09_564 [Francisellaceae bacterium]|nr:hypothetical protein [Francisellaceae bacterium]
MCNGWKKGIEILEEKRKEILEAHSKTIIEILNVRSQLCSRLQLNSDEEEKESTKKALLKLK